MTIYPYRELTITSKVQERCGRKFAAKLGEFEYNCVNVSFTNPCLLISDPRRGCYIVLPVFIFFFPPLLSGPYLWNRYSQRLQIECAAWSCCVILHYSLPSNSLRYFIYLFNFFFFSATILSAPYLWNCHS